MSHHDKHAIGHETTKARTAESSAGPARERRASALKVLSDAGAAPDEKTTVSRRGFVQVVGTGLALGAGTACYRPRQKIVPYVRRPPEVTPGNSLHFATAIPHEGFGFGVVVESHEGRPTKIEGNAEHPDSQGSAVAADQAYLVGLYDTDRGRSIRHHGAGVAWKTLLASIKERGEALAKDGGAGLRFLVEPSSSPLLADLRARIQARFPNAKFVAYSSIAAEGAAEGARAAFDRDLEVSHHLGEARVVAALDADLLDDGPETLRLNREFSAAREPGANMNRLYVVEPSPTVTGMMADHRMRLRGSEVLAATQALVAEVAALIGRDVLGPIASLPATPSPNLDPRFIKALAKDLAQNRGKSVVVAGRRQPAAVHALVHALNYALGNIGTTVKLRAPVLSDRSAGARALATLAEEIAAGKVDTLVITAWNPVYAAPVDFKFDKLLDRVPHTLYLGAYEDETAKVVKTFVPSAHQLESWGDARGTDGLVSLVQPLVEPLFSPHTQADVLAAFVGEGDLGAHRLLKQFWARKAAAESLVPVGTGFEGQWEHWLARGVIDGTAVSPLDAVTLDAAAMAGRLRPMLGGPSKADGIEVAFTVDSRILDGRNGNNPWLQEVPNPVTKVTWDNAVLVSQTTARKLDVKTGDLVQMKVGDRDVTGPVYVQPGHAEDAVTVSLGYGRAGAETVAADVGFNAGRLRASQSMWFVPGAIVAKAGSGHRFGITQENWSDEQRRPAKVGNLADFLAHDSAFNHELESERGLIEWQIHEPVDYSKEPYQWAMSIDLNKCTGCGSCVVACQAENNIPVVGREQVARGREMHWIRVDRYYLEAPGYAGPADKVFDATPVIAQPVMCVHCETAPCEYVCPVNATVHSDEGLNEMVYNRCVGTRYCSNNCPYKARRFNFLDFHGDPPEVEVMLRNPDVTVRSRGVMEKCTYCVQRIERARIDSRIEGRAIADGEIKTACQQTCPAQAIEFGSLGDRQSRVAKKHADPRRYDLLHELNTRPRTAYLARVRNPNPELA